MVIFAVKLLYLNSLFNIKILILSFCLLSTYIQLFGTMLHLSLQAKLCLGYSLVVLMTCMYHT